MNPGMVVKISRGVKVTLKEKETQFNLQVPSVYTSLHIPSWSENIKSQMTAVFLFI